MRYLSAILTLCALLGYFASTRDYPSARDADAYHLEVKAQADLLPDQFGDWLVVSEPEPPPAAQQLLRPNVIRVLALRRDTDGLRTNLIIVQCRDSRDMAGHYPPNCYPAHGWKVTDVEDATQEIEVNSRMIPVEEYEFQQVNFDGDRHKRIFNFFILPGKGFVRDIASVRSAAENYRLRPFGAAQVQVVFDASISQEQSVIATKEILGAVSPLFESMVQEAPQRGTP